METLPDEMLLHIFCYFNTYELSTVLTKVSLRWSHLINRTILRIREAVDVDKLNEGLKAVIVTERVPLLDDISALIIRFVKFAPKLQEITICRDYPFEDNDYRNLIHLPHLMHLDVFAKKKCVDRNTFISPSVTSLVINDPIGAGFLTNVAQSNQLRAFHMFGRCQFFTIKEMMNFLKVQTPYLKDLTLRCPELTDGRFRRVGHCLALVSLRLYTCALLTITGASYFENLANLRRLHLTGTAMLGVDGMHQLLASLPPHLEELNLSCSQFADEHCCALAARLPELRALELWRADVSADALLRLVCRLPALRALSTDAALGVRHLRGLARHTTLRHLRCRRSRPRAALPRPRRRLALPAPCARECLRGDDEGPSAEHYYYWTRGVVLRSLTSPTPDVAHDQIIVDAEDYSEDNLDLLDASDDLDDEPPEASDDPGNDTACEHEPVRMMMRNSTPSWAVVYVRRAGEGGGARGYTYVLEDVSARNTTLMHKVFNKGGLYSQQCKQYLQEDDDEYEEAQEDIIELEEDDEDDDSVDVFWEATPSPERPGAESSME